MNEQIYLRLLEVVPGTESVRVGWGQDTETSEIVTFCGDWRAMENLYLLMLAEEDGDTDGGLIHCYIQPWQELSRGAGFPLRMLRDLGWPEDFTERREAYRSWLQDEHTA